MMGSLVHVFADESGNFDFSTHKGASKYLILTTVTTTSCDIATEVLDLRRSLAFEGIDLVQAFHATEDKQAVRDRVYPILARYPIRIDTTLIHKERVYVHLRDEFRLYKTLWYYHLRHMVPRISKPGDSLLVVASSLGTRKQQAARRDDLEDVVTQVAPGRAGKAQMWPAAIEPCLQVADYACWAIQRKWETGDDRSYNLIKHNIQSEHLLF